MEAMGGAKKGKNATKTTNAQFAGNFRRRQRIWPVWMDANIATAQNVFRSGLKKETRAHSAKYGSTKYRRRMPRGRRERKM